jgi:hypothetical protein
MSKRAFYMMMMMMNGNDGCIFIFGRRGALMKVEMADLLTHLRSV